MKKLILFAFASTALISSCMKENEAMNPQGFTAINATNVPQAVQSTIKQAFPTAQVAYSVIQPNSLYVADVMTSNFETQVVI